MRLSLRTLLAFEDNIFDHEQHKQLERVIPQHDAALTALNRIRNVMRNPRLGVPGLVDQREELDPNLVAEYLDHQMSEEIQERFEAYCLSSDKYLAELASIHKVLASVLGEPARTSRECRLRCYDLYRQTVPNASIAAPFEERKQLEKTDQESFLTSSRQLFEDYLQSSPFQKLTSTATSELPQCPGAAQAANRPELIPLFRKNETENNMLPPYHLAQPQFTIYSAPQNPAPPVASISVPAQKLEFQNSDRNIIEEHWTASADSNAVNKDVSNSNTIKPSFSSRFWNWLTTSAQQKQPEIQKNQENQKSTRTGILVLIICAAALFGWNRLQQNNNGSISKTSSEISEEAGISDIAKPNPVTVPESKETTEVFDAWASTPLPSKKEIPKPAPNKEEQNKKTAEVTAAQMVPQQDSVVPSQLPELAPPALPADPFQPVAAELPERKTETKQEIPVTVEETKTISETKAQSIEENQPEKISSFIPNPIRSESSNAVVAQNIISKPATPPTVLHDQKYSVRPPIEQVSVKHDELVKDKSQDIAFNSIHPKSERKPQLIASPEEKPEQFGKESIIAFQPITATAKQREVELSSLGFVNPKKEAAPQSDKKRPQAADVWMTSVANQQAAGHSDNHFEKRVPNERISNEPAAIGKVTPKEKTVLSRPNAPLPPNLSSVITVGDVQETDQSRNSRPVGRVLSAKEPSVVFSASTSSEQWAMKRLPMELHADQYLLTTAPFSAELELEGGFRIEMVGDSKLSVLEPDENGIPGIFIDYGRLVIHPIAADNVGAVRPLRIQTEKVQGVVRLIGSKSLIFVDTFAEILENVPGEIGERSLLPKARPILGLLPDLDERVSWQTDKLESPLVATKQAGILLIPDKPELVNLQGLPNWLNRLPLPQEGEVFAKTCRRIFDETGGNCEVALNRLIRESSLGVRSFGYRLWGDLGRFDIPLAFLSEASPDDEPIRQMLVPYFREVMKRDEETVQRLADAIEAVRR